MKNLETLGFASIEFDGTTRHVYNGKMFTATGKISGYGSGKKTVATFTIDGTRYENIAVDRLRNILEGAKSTSTRTHRQNRVTADYCISKLTEFFKEVDADLRILYKVKKSLERATARKANEAKIADACAVLGISVAQYKQIKGAK